LREKLRRAAAAAAFETAPETRARAALFAHNFADRTVQAAFVPDQEQGRSLEETSKTTQGQRLELFKQAALRERENPDHRRRFDCWRANARYAKG